MKGAEVLAGDRGEEGADLRGFEDGGTAGASLWSPGIERVAF
jgi:hypothetical protein